jgi:hypothetical protein
LEQLQLQRQPSNKILDVVNEVITEQKIDIELNELDTFGQLKLDGQKEIPYSDTYRMDEDTPISTAMSTALSTPILTPILHQQHILKQTNSDVTILKHILIVEDSIPSLKLLSMLLKKQNLLVTGAENGLLAIEAVKNTNTSFHLILMVKFINMKK